MLKRYDIKQPSPHHSPGPKALGPRLCSVSRWICTSGHDAAVAANPHGISRRGRGQAQERGPLGTGRRLLCPATQEPPPPATPASGQGLACGQCVGPLLLVSRQPWELRPPAGVSGFLRTLLSQIDAPIPWSVFHAIGDPDCPVCLPSTVAYRESQ